MFVLDTSVAVAWHFEDQGNDYVIRVWDRLTNERAVVPKLFLAEFANAIVSAVRSRKVSREDAGTIILGMASLPIDVDRDGDWNEASVVMELATGLNLTAYDATYLQLALARRIPLATQDRALLDAARTLGVTVL
ncbi:MAG: type II toxin-antitoxin system VapC family toxin [Alphaproteobacteria bacterium]|nr:type II toxin-antitoxin system VapC family toxin [Alphaproteobacteria bacterium]